MKSAPNRHLSIFGNIQNRQGNSCPAPISTYSHLKPFADMVSSFNHWKVGTFSPNIGLSGVKLSVIIDLAAAVSKMSSILLYLQNRDMKIFFGPFHGDVKRRGPLLIKNIF